MSIYMRNVIYDSIGYSFRKPDSDLGDAVGSDRTSREELRTTRKHGRKKDGTGCAPLSSTFSLRFNYVILSSLLDPLSYSVIVISAINYL